MKILNTTLENALLLKNIYSGNLYPIDKLLNENEIQTVLDEYSYKNELGAIPYLFFIDEKIESNEKILVYYLHELICTIIVEDCFKIDLEEYSEKLFKTKDASHNGVNYILSNKDKFILSGKIDTFNEYALTYQYTNEYIGETVFQSRNPAHSAHEKIIKKYSPNLTYTTPMITTKSSDYPFKLKMKTYEKIKEIYDVGIYVSTLPRLFAGPREALQNCLLFQNMGAKSFIMGRGKNCVGSFYGDSESYDFCKKYFDEGLLKINPIWEDTQFDINGDEIKASIIKSKYIDNGLIPPETLMSNYISQILLER